jgi:hypothetical protein
MSKRLVVVNQTRPRIVSRKVVDEETMSGRVSKNTTYHAEEVYSMLRIFTRECIAALQAGETVKLDGLLTISPNMKVGGEVTLTLRPDRGAMAGLNNPTLWTADKVANHANLAKGVDELVALWNKEHPDDPVTD